MLMSTSWIPAKAGMTKPLIRHSGERARPPRPGTCLQEVRPAAWPRLERRTPL